MTHIKDRENDFSNQDIFVGLDVHKKMWKVSIFFNGYEQKNFTQPARVEALLRYLNHHYPGGKYNSVYEAGFSGYWIDYRLKEKGVNNIVVNPADVPTKDKERRNKTDRVDAKKLAKSLSSGDLVAIHVPSREETEDRSLVRLREWLIKDQTRLKNRIKGSLNFYGEIVPEADCEKYWSGKYIEWIEGLTMLRPSGKSAMQELLEELKEIRKRIAKITKEIKAMSMEDKYAGNIKLLNTIPGIGILSSMIILTELIDINRFGNLDRLNCYVGLIPSEHSSGEEEHKGEMIHRGNSSLKRILVECAWIAVRKDPRLALEFKKLSMRMKKNRAIIKIARKLLNRIRYVLKNQKPYVFN